MRWDALEDSLREKVDEYWKESREDIFSQPPDESGVTAENFLYNIEADRLYCILHAANKEAIEKHHKKYGVTCEWIMEIKTSA